MERPDDTALRPAPEWSVSQWFNTDGNPTLAGLRGRVVMIEAFQMLCPGCVAHGLPLAQPAHRLFPRIGSRSLDSTRSLNSTPR